MRALLKFERENRAYFTAWVPDWGDDYFARFEARHRALLAEQSAGTCYFHVLVDGAGEVVGRVNLVDLPTVRPSSFTGSPSARPAGAGHVCGASGQWARVHRLQPDVAAGHTAPDNLASQAVLTWAGFVLAGSVELDGQPEVRFVRDLTVDGTGRPADRWVPGRAEVTACRTAGRLARSYPKETHGKAHLLDDHLARRLRQGGGG
jgi:ribosomal-protein-alanine N-acetyltransferase